MAAWHEGYVHTNGIDTHYYRTGGGLPALILLHGITDNGLCWTRVARDLQDSYDVIMPDARGHGLTGGRVEGISLSMLANDLAAFIRVLRLEQPFLFGHSMGAMTAVLVATNYPNLVRAIVLEDPPFDVQRSRDQVEEWIARVHEFKSLSRERLVARVRSENPSWADDEIEPWADAQAQVDPGVLHVDFGEPWRDVLARITCPLLLITADTALEAIVTAEQAQQAVELAARGEVAYIKGAGHSIHRERYDETMQAIREFLRRN